MQIIKLTTTENILIGNIISGERVVVLCDSTDGLMTVRLPSETENIEPITFAKNCASTNTVTINNNDETESWILTAEDETLTLYHDKKGHWFNKIGSSMAVSGLTPGQVLYGSPTGGIAQAAGFRYYTDGGGGVGGPFTELLVTDVASSSYIGLSTGFATAGKYFWGLRGFIGTGGGTDYTIHATQESGVLTVLKMLDEFNFYKYDAAHYSGAKQYLQYGGVDIIAGSGEFSIAPSATNVSMLDVTATSVSKLSEYISKQTFEGAGVCNYVWDPTLLQYVLTTSITSAMKLGSINFLDSTGNYSSIRGTPTGHAFIGLFSDSRFGAAIIYEATTPIVDKYQPIFSGIVDKTKIVPTLADRKFKITCASGAKVFCGGFPYYPTTFEMEDAFADVTGSYFFYWDSSGVLTVTNTPWDILTTSQIAWCYHNATDNFQMLFDDRHPGGGTSMSEADHAQEHLRNGAWIKSGCVITASAALPATGASMACAVSDGVLADEDLFTTITGKTSTDSAVLLSRIGTESEGRVIGYYLPAIGITTTSNMLVVNYFANGEWSLYGAGTPNKWYCMFCFVAPSINPADGTPYEQVCYVMPQKEHSSLLDAQNETSATLLLGKLVLQEAVFVGKKIYKYKNNAETTPDVELVQVQIISENRTTFINNLAILHSATTGRDALASHPIGAISGTNSLSIPYYDATAGQYKESATLTATRIPIMSAAGLIDASTLFYTVATGTLDCTIIKPSNITSTTTARFIPCMGANGLADSTSSMAGGSTSYISFNPAQNRLNISSTTQSQIRAHCSTNSGYATLFAENDTGATFQCNLYGSTFAGTTAGVANAGNALFFATNAFFMRAFNGSIYVMANDGTVGGDQLICTFTKNAGAAIVGPLSNSFSGASAITTKNSTSACYAELGTTAGTTVGYVGTTTAHPFEVRYNATTFATIDSTGLGIGKLAAYVFDVASSVGTVAVRNSTARAANGVQGAVILSGKNAGGTGYTEHCIIKSLFDSASNAQSRFEIELSDSGGTKNKVFSISSTGGVAAVGGFGCNTKAAQTAYASSATPATGGTGATAGAFDTAAHRDALITAVENIRLALVANGIMS